jgi:hypothetical protein
VWSVQIEPRNYFSEREFGFAADACHIPDAMTIGASLQKCISRGTSMQSCGGDVDSIHKL